jgi:hypothetical protein
VDYLRRYLSGLFIASLHSSTEQIIPNEFAAMLTLPETNVDDIDLRSEKDAATTYSTSEDEDEDEDEEAESPVAVSSQVEAEERAREDEAVDTEFAFFEEQEEDEDDDGSSQSQSQLSELSSGGKAITTAAEEEEMVVKQTAGVTQTAEVTQTAGAKQTVGDYFWSRIKQRDPAFNGFAYSRICQSNVNRQPAILTKAELDQIDETHKGKAKPYSGEPLKYRQSKNGEDLYYICPKYWCMKSDQVGPISEADVNAGKCGKLITDPNDIKPGEFVYQATAEYAHIGFVNRGESTQARQEQATGKKGAQLTDEQKGLCFPCCFRTNGNALKNTIQKCTTGVDPKRNKGRVSKLAEEDEAEELNMNSGQIQPLMNTTPLPLGRIGFMPVAVRRMLNASTNLCLNRQNFPEPNCPVLVRYGVLQPEFPEQSFLASLADIYAYQRRDVSPPHISEFRRLLAHAIDLDRFVKLHNASLVALFRNSRQQQQQPQPQQEASFRPYVSTQL